LNENIGKNNDQVTVSKHIDYHNLVPAHILEGLYTFCTKSFLVRYSEEEVTLNYIVQFRTMLDTPVPKSGLPFYLEAELLFSDLSNLTGPKRIIGLTATQVFPYVHSRNLLLWTSTL